MNKSELFKKLNVLNLDKNKYYILSGASLVAQNIIDETNDIDLSCDKDLYDSLNWNTSIGAFNREIKQKDCFEISTNLYEFKDKAIKINGYNFANLENILEVKLMLNRPKDQEIIKHLQSIIKR